MIAFTVPGKPISLNDAYRWSGGRGQVKSAECVGYQNRIKAFARQAMRGAKPIAGDVECRIRFVFQSERPDIDGPLKWTLDALQGVAIENDRQIREVYLSRAKDKDRPRVEIAITEVTP